MKRLLMTSESIETLEEMLNKYFYSKSYKIIDKKVMYSDPLVQNKHLVYSMKGQKHQIYVL